MTDIREAIQRRPMQWQQVAVVAICVLLTMIDGYEVIVMPFTMPHLAKAWGLSSVQAGYLLSAGVFGMAIGAVAISPLADRIGRRPQILLCLVFITIGMLLSATAQDFRELLVYRTFAGLFIGGVIASINVLVSEYCSEKRRGVVMGLYGIGLPLGSALAGSVIGPLVAHYGWRGPFVFGGLLTLFMTFVVFFVLPESVDFLIARRPRKALDKYNRIAAWLGYERVSVLPGASAGKQEKGRGGTFAAIFGGAMARRTAYLWLGYAGLIAAFYFANTWTAKLLTDVSGSSEFGVRVGTLVMYGGVIGAIVFALLAIRIRPVLVTVLILAGGAIVFTLYATILHDLQLAATLSLLIGLCSGGGVLAFYAISPPLYPAIVRGTAVGLMLAFGRAVSVLVPIGTGYMLTAGWAPSSLYRVFGAILAVAAILTLLLDRACATRTPAAEPLAKPRKQPG